MDNMFCFKCGSKLDEGDTFCPNCGINNYKEEPKSKNNTGKIFRNIFIITIALAISFVGIRVYIRKDMEKNHKQIEVSSYILKANNFETEMLLTLEDIEKLGNNISSYWNDYINNNKYNDVDDAIDNAFKDNETLVKKIKTTKETEIDKTYKELLEIPDNSNNKLIEIKSAIKELYEEYYDFYYLILSPSGNYINFTSEFSRLDTSTSKKFRNLDILLN